MAATTPTAIKGTSITQPTADPANHKIVLGQLKETTEIAQRQRGDPNDSFVRVSELLNVTGAKLVNGTIQPPAASTSSGTGGTVSVQDSISGTGAVGSPLQLVNDSASPGNNKLYGTNGSGVLGWYAQPSAGSSNPFNVTPDTHTATPGFLSNDEFEYGSTIDASGARFTGAIAWSWTNQNAATAVVTDGALVMTCDPSTTGDNNSILMQPMSASTWTFNMKYAVHNGNGGNGSYGFIVYNSGTTKYTKFGVYNPTSSFQPVVQQLNTPTLYHANTLLGGVSFPSLTSEMEWLYLQVVNNGTSLTYSWSLTGVPGSWVQLYSETLASWLGGVTNVGICVNQNTTGITPAMLVDWFRRTA